MPTAPDALALIESCSHKLDLADYHRKTLQTVFLDNQEGISSGEEHVKLEAHLEALAFTGAAAMEKLVRAFHPQRDRRVYAAELIREAQGSTRGDERSFLDALASWYSGRESDRIEKFDRRGQSAPVANIANEIRNAAAHGVYVKDAGRPDEWLMIIEGGTVSGTFRIQEFVSTYASSLGHLADLRDEARRLASREDVPASR